jgi:predicted acyltransferase
MTLLDMLGRFVGASWAGWIYTLGIIAMWWFVLLFLHRKRIFVRV